MTIIEKIKQSIEMATGLPFIYHAAGEINELLTQAKSLPIAYSFLIDSGTVQSVNGNYHEQITLAVMFCDKTEFDFNAIENEQIIDQMKVKAYKWLQSLRDNSNALRIVSVNSTQRLYDNTTAILTGYAVNITLQDTSGEGDCTLPDVVIPIESNGEYNVVGVDKVNVNVVPKLQELEITENGEYLPPTDIAGFSKVNVNVQPVLEELTITTNGTYTPSEGVDGFSQVVANVVPTKKVVIPSGMQVRNNLIIDGYWAGELVDTSKVTNMNRMFGYCTLLKQVDVSDWNVNNVTDMGSMFEQCSIASIDVSNWDTSSVTKMPSMFSRCNLLQQIDVSDWNTSNVTDMSNMFYNCSSLQQVNIDNWDIGSVRNVSSMFQNCGQLVRLYILNWDTNNITNMSYMFGYCGSLLELNVSEWNTSSVTNMSGIFGYCSSLQQLDVSNWDTSNVTNMGYLFASCQSLQQLDVIGWDMSNVTNINALFNYCLKLTSLIGGRLIEEVLANNTSCLNGLKISVPVSTFQSSTKLDRASLRAVINGLADLTGQTAQTLTLGATLMAKLTEEDIAIATNKNWTIA